MCFDHGFFNVSTFRNEMKWNHQSIRRKGKLIIIVSLSLLLLEIKEWNELFKKCAKKEKMLDKSNCKVVAESNAIGQKITRDSPNIYELSFYFTV